MQIFISFAAIYVGNLLSASVSHNKTIKINGENKGNNVNKNQIHNKKGIPTAAANE